MAKLPDELEEVGIAGMIDGESGWTVPWAMYADRSGDLWLNGNYTIEDHSGGTLEMYIEKRNGKYIVNISGCKDHKWSKGDSCYTTEFTPIFVDKLIK